MAKKIAAQTMSVDTAYSAVGALFDTKIVFRVPKYQRGYAWEKAEIDDFIRDVDRCFEARKAKKPINHFFGGIVSVGKNISGTINQVELELIDGQQRVATFVLLISSIISRYKVLLSQAQALPRKTTANVISTRMEELQKRFIEFRREIGRRTFSVEVLQLSKFDHQYFSNLIRLQPATISRDSHKKLELSFNLISAYVETKSNNADLNKNIDNLELFTHLIDADVSVIHIDTSNKNDAYTLFRVLNDRGKSLTDGDLLRAMILELLEEHPTHQNAVEHMWDEMLSESYSVVEENLKWLYQSHAGTRPNNDSFTDNFITLFFPGIQGVIPKNNVAVAQSIVDTTSIIYKEFITCRQLRNGEWPYQRIPPIEVWDTNRLTLLIKELGISIVIPFLIAACKLNQRDFAEIVQVLERFMFRYKIIGLQHAGSITTILSRETMSLRSTPRTFTIRNLRNQLRTIQDAKVPDDLFKTQLKALNYRQGGGNQPIKYFLTTVEYYYQWYKSGATGEPNCTDKSIIYDFTGTTIEHIYPNNAPATTQAANPVLEQVKNSFGNLTIMGSQDNGLGGNQGFFIKKPIFERSAVAINREIGSNAQWSISEVQTRADELANMACSIFKI
jgi:hypothetical protein